jgi:hypothetical protein
VTTRQRLIIGCICVGLIFQLPHSAAAQTQQAQPSAAPQLHPLSLPHTYWHFLIYVNVLDQNAAAQGQSSEWLQNDLQTRLQFSDADFTPVRASAQRLASELATLNPLMNSLASATPSASQMSEMTGLIAQRDAYISSEIASLAQALTPQKRAALEAFMTQFLAPKTLTPQATAATANQ